MNTYNFKNHAFAKIIFKGTGSGHRVIFSRGDLIKYVRLVMGHKYAVKICQDLINYDGVFIEFKRLKDASIYCSNIQQACAYCAGLLRTKKDIIGNAHILF